MRPGRAMKKAKKEGKKENQRFDNHTFAQTIRVAIPTKVCMWGGVPNVVNQARFRQNWLRGFWLPEGSKSAFSYT